MTNVRQFTDQELLCKVEDIGGEIPNSGKYFIIGVQSIEDRYNVFDDKFYVYDGSTFIMTSSGTTNAGATALKHFDNYSLNGVAVWKTNQVWNRMSDYRLLISASWKRNKPVDYALLKEW